MTANDRPAGRGWAYLGAILGGAVSIAANVAHSYVPPTTGIDEHPLTVAEQEEWQPEGGAVIGAVFWPIAVLVVVEIFARVVWPEGKRWVALRFGGLAPVALVAAVVSYRHMSGLLDWYREDGLTAVIGPLAVDGLMVMATGALIATSKRRVAQTGPVDLPLPVQETAVADQSTDTAQTGPVDLSKAPVVDHPEDRSTDGPARRSRTTRTARPRTARRTSPKVRSIESGTTNRLDRLRTDFPKSIPSNGEIKTALGIKSQGTANDLRKALIAERDAKEAAQ